jgi:hypothetical protein
VLDYYGTGRGESAPDQGPEAWPDPGISGVMPTRLSPPKPPNLRRFPGLDKRLGERWTRALVEAADIIDAVDSSTGRTCRVLHGDPATESRPVDLAGPWTPPTVVKFWVDRRTDELESLVRVVRRIKGSYRFVKDLRDILGEPEAVADPRSTDLIDGGMADCVVLSYIDPATGSVPISRLEPWLAPAVTRVQIHPLGDDLDG